MDNDVWGRESELKNLSFFLSRLRIDILDSNLVRKISEMETSGIIW